MDKSAHLKHVLFYRRLLSEDAGTNGGNLKLRDSYDHFATSENWEAKVFTFRPWRRWPCKPWSFVRMLSVTLIIAGMG